MWFERNPEGIPIAKIMDSLLLKNGRNHVSKKINTEFFYKNFRDFSWKAIIGINRVNGNFTTYFTLNQGCFWTFGPV